MYQAIFSDVDGTLLNQNHQVTPLTQKALHQLMERNIPFVVVSARSPSGIFPILKDYQLKASIIAYNGALVMDQQRYILAEKGMVTTTALQVLKELETFDVAWCVYSFDQWFVKSRHDERILREESIVKAQSLEATLEDLQTLSTVHKILCICHSSDIFTIEQHLQQVFPQCTIVRSSDILIEIVDLGINKAKAVQKLCQLWHIPLKNVVAFGDQYNDLDMLMEVGYGWAMGNAPVDIQKKVGRVTQDNNHDGIYHALKSLDKKEEHGM